MEEHKKHLELVNRLFHFISGSTTCFKTWGFYLKSKDFKSEPELINKVGVIWICSIFDTVKAGQKHLREISEEASQKGFYDIVANCYEMEKFCTVSCDFLQQFSFEEQIFLMDCRHQSVHGYQSNLFSEIEYVSITYAKDHIVTKERIKKSTYRRIIWDFYKWGKTPDELMEPLVERALNEGHEYWNAIKIMLEIQDIAYEVMQKKGKIRISSSIF